MIVIEIYRNKSDEVYGFKASNHGDEIVCSAVSALTINTINSINCFTDVVGVYKYKTDGGFLVFKIDSIKNGNSNKDVNLLFGSMLLGLNSIMNEYSEHLKIID